MTEIVIKPRETYMQRIRPYIGKNIIKILTGQRRVGKSYILKAVQREIKHNIPNANIIEINLEDFAFSHITDAQTLHSAIASKLTPHAKNYIFVDEVQEVENFDKVIRSLHLDENNDIYVTGSNSAMLSAEIASRLAGRSIEIQVHPLSYQEFLQFHNLPDSDESCRLYLQYGGMPYLVNLPHKPTWHEYLTGLTDAVIYRDVVNRHQLRNTDFLQRLVTFFADNIGQIYNAKKIADYLKSQRTSISVSTIQSYMKYIADAYIVRSVSRWDIEGKRLFEIGEKVYFEDLGLRNSIIGFRPHDIGALMENAVYCKLIADGYNVKVGVLPKGHEIDFVAERGHERIYIQVALTVADRDTAEREYGNLLSIKDNYDKIVVTLHDESSTSFEGIRTLSLRQWLNS